MNASTSLQAAAVLLATSVAQAQTLRYDGLQNTSVGNAQITVGANEQLIVSNIGSSGQDGVRIDLGDSEGMSFGAALDLGPNGRCELIGRVRSVGADQLVQAGLTIQPDGTGTGSVYTPSLDGLGNPTYTLRAMLGGQVVYDQGGHTGGTRMQSGGGLNSLPQKVYMLENPFGPWGGAYLMCSDWGGGGVIVTPPGGQPIAADFVEFRSEPGQITGVASVEVRLADVAGDLEIEGEELRFAQHFMANHDGAELDAEPTGKLKVSNLGSSGCDGVSIVLPDETDEVHGELDELRAPQLPGGTFTLESRCASGEADELVITESGGRWFFTPDFAPLGSPTYSVELFLDGQPVFSQSSVTGTLLATTAWALFYKKTTERPDGTIVTEWCIGTGEARPHSIVGGPTVLADMFTLRSEPIQVDDASIGGVSVRANDDVGEFWLVDVGEPGPCVGDSYCVAAVNSTGAGAHICTEGSASVAANDLVLTCTNVPANQFGLFFYGTNQAFAPLGNGTRCVGGQLFRLPVSQANGAGLAMHVLDNTAPPQPAGQISAGQTWYFQFWYRDVAGGGAGFNLSDGQAVTFQP